MADVTVLIDLLQEMQLYIYNEHKYLQEVTFLSTAKELKYKQLMDKASKVFKEATCLVKEQGITSESVVPYVSPIYTRTEDVSNRIVSETDKAEHGIYYYKDDTYEPPKSVKVVSTYVPPEYSRGTQQDIQSDSITSNKIEKSRPGRKRSAVSINIDGHSAYLRTVQCWEESFSIGLDKDMEGPFVTRIRCKLCIKYKERLELTSQSDAMWISPGCSNVIKAFLLRHIESTCHKDAESFLKEESMQRKNCVRNISIKKKSAVWDYCSLQSNGGNNVVCNICGAVLKRQTSNNSTTSMIYHLTAAHGIELPCYQEQVQGSVQRKRKKVIPIQEREARVSLELGEIKARKRQRNEEKRLKLQERDADNQFSRDLMSGNDALPRRFKKKGRPKGKFGKRKRHRNSQQVAKKYSAAESTEKMSKPNNDDVILIDDNSNDNPNNADDKNKDDDVDATAELTHTQAKQKQYSNCAVMLTKAKTPVNKSLDVLEDEVDISAPKDTNTTEDTEISMQENLNSETPATSRGNVTPNHDNETDIDVDVENSLSDNDEGIEVQNDNDASKVNNAEDVDPGESDNNNKNGDSNNGGSNHDNDDDVMATVGEGESVMLIDEVNKSNEALDFKTKKSKDLHSNDAIQNGIEKMDIDNNDDTDVIVNDELIKDQNDKDELKDSPVIDSEITEPENKNGKEHSNDNTKESVMSGDEVINTNEAMDSEIVKADSTGKDDVLNNDIDKVEKDTTDKKPEKDLSSTNLTTENTESISSSGAVSSATVSSSQDTEIISNTARENSGMMNACNSVALDSVTNYETYQSKINLNKKETDVVNNNISLHKESLDDQDITENEIDSLQHTDKMEIASKNDNFNKHAKNLDFAENSLISKNRDIQLNISTTTKSLAKSHDTECHVSKIHGNVNDDDIEMSIGPSLDEEPTVGNHSAVRPNVSETTDVSSENKNIDIKSIKNIKERKSKGLTERESKNEMVENVTNDYNDILDSTSENKIRNIFEDVSSDDENNLQDENVCKEKPLQTNVVDSASEKIVEAIKNSDMRDAAPFTKACETSIKVDEANKDVIRFFTRPDVSCIIPGMEPTIVWLQGQKHSYQKYYMNMYLHEAYEIYEKENKDSVPFLKFCSMKPNYVKMFHETQADQCQCQIHENLISKLKALNISYSSEFWKKVLCVDSINSKCWKSECNDCLNGSKVRSLVDLNMKTEVMWTEWESVGAKDGSNRLMLSTKTGNVGKLLKCLREEFSKILLHVNMKKIQQDEFKDDLHNPKKRVLQIDYPMPYVNDAEKEVQSAIWSDEKINLFSATSIQNGITNNFLLAYDERSGKETTAHYFIQYLYEHFLNKMETGIPKPMEEIIWSSSAPHFKNSFTTLCLKVLTNAFKRKFLWKFFASGHEVGLAASIGAEAKWLVNEKISDNRPKSMGSKKFAQLAQNCLPKTDVVYMNPKVYSPKSINTQNITEGSSDLDGIHMIECDVQTNNISLYEHSRIISVKDDIVRVGDWVVVSYDGVHYPGEVLKIIQDDYEVTVMHPSGKNYKWPETPDQLFYKKINIVKKLSGGPKPLATASSRNIGWQFADM